MCGEDLERNSVNGSDSRESAAREISFFFPHLLSGSLKFVNGGAVNVADEIPDGDTCLSVHHPFAKQKTDKLWEALMDGDIDILSSDHSPSDLEHKLFVEGQVRKSLSAKPHADGYFHIFK
ncbi:putative allantoinase [Helianthus annuus]|nr:putative allantoinase [Helianthus annuus]